MYPVEVPTHASMASIAHNAVCVPTHALPNSSYGPPTCVQPVKFTRTPSKGPMFDVTPGTVEDQYAPPGITETPRAFTRTSPVTVS